MHRDKMVANFLMGTRRLYDFVDDNPIVNMFPVNYVNDPFVIGQNDNVVAINSAIQVDLMGQVVADTMGPMQFTGIGGQVDFVRGAARSSGGKAIIALPSTARKGTVSRIVPEIGAGAAVTTMRADVDYVVTEYGVAHLRGKGLRERAGALLDIAHPEFRDQIREEAAAVYGPAACRAGNDQTYSPEESWTSQTSRRPRSRLTASAASERARSDGHARSASTAQPKTLITGNGALDQLGDEAKKLDGTKVLIITDPGVPAPACVDDGRGAAAGRRPRGRHLRRGRPRAAHEQRRRDRRASPRRAATTASSASAAARRWTSPRWSPCCVGTGKTVEDFVGVDKVPKKGLPIIAVPTTAGTGSEVTAIAIFANEKLNVKQGVVSPYLIPNIALVDPALTVSCPPNVTAASGMDALIHNIEAYISVNATMHTDPLAYEGIKLISQEHPHRHRTTAQHVGAPQHGHGLAARRHRLRQRRRRRRPRPLVSHRRHVPRAARRRQHDDAAVGHGVQHARLPAVVQGDRRGHGREHGRPVATARPPTRPSPPCASWPTTSTCRST